jgi:uncharacterized membrane protein YhaH (DUF805 family)
MGFTSAIRSCFHKYAVFRGRARRTEYWCFLVFQMLLSLLAYPFGRTAQSLLGIALLLPTLAVGARRMHDVSRSGWLQLLILIPVVGWIFWAILACLPGHRRTNRYGLDPLLAR